MGNTTSSKDANALEGFYSQVIGKHMLPKTTTGGSASGGYSALEDYGNSVYSGAKEKLIRGIAKDVSSILKVSSTFAETADIKEVVSKLSKLVPSPMEKRNLKPNSDIHSEICTKLADSINKQYDMNIIDKTADPAIICNKVSEIMYSLFTGLHSEFLTVASDVSRILSNLQILQEYVDSANKKLISDLEKSHEGSDAEVESIKILYTKLTDEIERQHTILANITNSVIGPVGESLITILEDNDDFASLTADLKKMTGPIEFGNKLGYLLNGTSSVAYAAQIVDKALKEIGMSVKEYKSVTSIKDLREKIYNSMVKQKPSSENLYKLLIASDLIYKNDLAHDQIVEYLEKKGGYSGGASTEYDTHFADAAEISTEVINIDGPFKGRTQSAKLSMEKQLNQKRQLRKQLFSVLNGQIRDIYDKIKYTLTMIGKKIGSEIQLSPELDMFIRQLNNFADSQPDRQNIHMALSGYRKDTNSSFVKYQFMENLEAISESSESLIQKKNGEIFSSVKQEVDNLLNLIDEFNKTFTNTISDIHVNSLGKKGGDCGCSGGEEEMEGGHNGVDHSMEETEGGITTAAELEEKLYDDMEDPEVSGGKADYESMVYTTLGGVVASIPESEFTHYKTMKKSIREIDYYYRIAGVKQNMQQTSMEFENNTENYENILGEEAGYIIDQIQYKYNNLIRAIDTEVKPDDMKAEKMYAHNYDILAVNSRLRNRLEEDIKGANIAAVDKSTMTDYENGYKFLLEYIRSSKVEMLEASQALDLYLSKFTQSIQFKPDQIKDFVQILEQIEIVAKWFTDKSGDNLVGVYEAFSPDALPAAFPSELVANFPALGTLRAGNIDNTLLTDSYSITEKHYYERLETKAGPGKFYAPRMMTRVQAVNFVKQIEKSVKSVRALENIINTFSRVNTNVSSDVKTFMSSGLMFKAFMKYCVASVISVGYLELTDPGFGGPVPPTPSKITATFANTVAGAAVPVDCLKAIHVKMAVGLRFNKDSVKYETATNRSIELCDPLSIRTDKDMQGNSTFKNNDICDSIFEMSIKSMIAKVFTIVGSYTLFNKPAQDQSNSFSMSINPLRQILGGAKHVGIIPDATELYIRLPLLTEWYRSVFEFNDSGIPNPNPPVAMTKQGDPLISMIPDMDSIWGSLCKVIFLDAKNIVDGAYPSEYANKIIESVNTIYKHYNAKKPGISCREILTEFVLEINRRYGFIMREEIKLYLQEKNSYITIDEEYPGDNSRVDYDLLDVESQMGRKPAPSDKFRAFSKEKSARKYDTKDLFKVVKRFRQSIEANLQLPSIPLATATDADFRTIASISLSGIVSETKRKVIKSADEEDKYQVIHEQLHGIEKFGDLDQAKLVMFHETVITPLTVLYFTYLILNDYNRFCISLNPGLDGDLAPDAVTNLFTAKSFLDLNIKNFKDNSYYKIESSKPVPNAMSSIFSTAEYLGYLSGTNNRQTMYNTNVMEDLLRKVMNVGCDMNGLTEIYFVGSGSIDNYPVINYDKLEETCTNLFNDAKLAMHNLRKFMPKPIIDKYELLKDINDSTIENRISLFYIQEQLFDRLFANKFGNGLTDANTSLKNIYLTSTKPYPARPPLLPVGSSFNRVFSKIAFWDVNDSSNYTNHINQAGHANLTLRQINETTDGLDFPTRYIPLFKTGTTIGNPAKGSQTTAVQQMVSRELTLAEMEPLHKKTVISKQIPGANYNIYIGTRFLYDFDDSTINQIHSNLGLIPKFNSILYKYCTMFIDRTTKKIYKPLLEKFANGHNAKDIFSGKNINDNLYLTGVVPNHRSNPLTYLDKKKKNVLQSYYRHTSKLLIDEDDDEDEYEYEYAPFENKYMIGEHNIKRIDKHNSNPKAKLTINTSLPKKSNSGSVSPNETSKLSSTFSSVLSSVSLSETSGLPSISSSGLPSISSSGLPSISSSETSEFPLILPNELPANLPNQLLFSPTETNAEYLNKLSTLFMIDFTNKSSNENDKNEFKIYLEELKKDKLEYMDKADNLGQRRADKIYYTRRNCIEYVNKFLNNKKLLSIDPEYIKKEGGSAPGRNPLYAAICKTEPQPNAIIFASVANAIKGILMSSTDRVAGVASLYTEDNFLNINEYQKELMRANLPGFEKELNLLIKKAEFMRRCLEETAVQVNSAATVGADRLLIPDLLQNTPAQIDPSYTQPNKISITETNAVRKSYLIGIYDDVMTSCKSLIRCINDTQKELNDTPTYFETYNESIIDYEKRNGHMPLMPISHITHLMNFSSFVPGNEAPYSIKYKLSVIPQPSMAFGSPEFKFTYGTRGLLHYAQEPSIKFAPGASEILNSYNNKLGGAATFDASRLDSITKGVVQLSRWVIDYMYHKRVLCNHDWYSVQNLLLDNQQHDIPIKDRVVQNLSCQTAKATAAADYTFWGSTANIILISENDNFKQSMYRMVSCLSAGKNANKLYGSDRAEFRIYNILDLNIVPINVHAMQREIPFVNLFNYSYTFNHMVKNFTGVTTKNAILFNVGGEYPGAVDEYTNLDFAANSKPEDTLVRHLMYPLGYRRAEEYANHTYRIMSGSMSLSSNRPKYLSDQLWNKVLMNSLYVSTAAISLPPVYNTNGVNLARLPSNVNEPMSIGIINRGPVRAQCQVSNALSYIENVNGVPAVTPFAPRAAATVDMCGYEGYLRYNSKLVRWAEWFAQLQRVTRLLMRSQLEWIQDPVAHSSDAISESVTEYKPAKIFDLGDYE